MDSFSNLNLIFKDQLKEASKCYIAVALMKDYGMNLLREAPGSCEVKLLLGIDLPTPYNVLNELLSSSIHFRVFENTRKTFHPKVYLLEVKGKWQAYVGSANFTKGGFESNVEMTVCLADEDITTKLLSWFDKLYKQGRTIDQIWLDDYQQYLTEINELNSKKQKLLQSFKGKNGDPLAPYDFSEQFFQYEHYNAFSGNKPRDSSAQSVKERDTVAAKLFDLHKELFPLIQSKNWKIEPHYQETHIISSIEHSTYTNDQLNSVWLSYNRPKKEIKRLIKDLGETQTPLFQMRLQVLVRLEDVAIHLTIGKDKNGGWRERNNLKTIIQEGSQKLSSLQLLLSKLPSSYYINVANDLRTANTLTNLDELRGYLSKDDVNKYYLFIGRAYTPDDPKISKQNIVSTVQHDFELLMPIYELLKVPVS